jgi:2-polyprenyl-6-methoxyphenol hydroxylase-like FAD-dependent oxidoreductase
MLSRRSFTSVNSLMGHHCPLVLTAPKYYHSYATVSKVLRVGINGGTISGLTTALAIKHTPTAHDIAVTVQVFDGQKRDMFNKSQGVILTNAAMDIFNKLGVGKEIEKSGRILEEYLIRNHRFDTDFARVHFKPAVAIRKNVLLDILSSALQKGGNSPNTVIYNRNEPMRHVEQMEDGTFHVSRLSNFGKKIFDVLVGSEDTPDSLVREKFFTGLEDQQNYDVESVMAIIDLPAQLDTANKIVEWWGKQSRLGCFLIDDHHLCVYSSVKTQELGKDISGVAVLRQLLMLYRKFKSQGTEILMNEIERIQNNYISSSNKPDHTAPVFATTITKRGYRIENPTNGNRVVLIGDAAGYKSGNLLLMDSTLHVLTGHELAVHLCQTNPNRGPQEVINIYALKSQEILSKFEAEDNRFKKHLLTLPSSFRFLRLMLYKPIGLGPSYSIKNFNRFTI